MTLNGREGLLLISLIGDKYILTKTEDYLKRMVFRAKCIHFSLRGDFLAKVFFSHVEGFLVVGFLAKTQSRKA